MKHLLTTLFLVLTVLCGAFAQTRIDGTVTDARGPLVGVNVFVVGTLDGGITDTLGRFSFTTERTGEQTLRAVLLGYEEYETTVDAATFRNMEIRLREKAASLDEVVVTASTYSLGKSNQIKTMDALDVVMSGNSCGDLVAALQVLPGTTVVGENGKLYVRGGESEECQTFVNGMHVLVPYSTNVEGQGQRGRFSPFLFKGMSFSLGGYGGEYGQALSSVLPMETTDVASGDKLGVSASLLDWNLGGTKAFRQSSLSFNAALTDLGLYTKLFPDRCDWTRPYRKLSGEAQYKLALSPNSVLKTYAGYDWTSVGMRTEGRSLSMNEHNVYANATLRTQFGQGCTLFAGVAESFVLSDIDDALAAGDHYHNTRNEVHLKAELSKRFSPLFKLSAGVEDYLRGSGKRYDDTGYDLKYHLLAAHLDAQLRIVPRLFLNVSARGERLSYNGEWLLMPRATLSFVPGTRFQASVMAGRYSQTPEDDYIARGAVQAAPEYGGPPDLQHAVCKRQHADPGRALLQMVPSPAAALRRRLDGRRIRLQPRHRRVSGRLLAAAQSNPDGGLFLQRFEPSLPGLRFPAHAGIRLAAQPSADRQIRSRQVYRGLGGDVCQRPRVCCRNDTFLQQPGRQYHLAGASEGDRLRFAQQPARTNQRLSDQSGRDAGRRHAGPLLLYRNIRIT